MDLLFQSNIQVFINNFSFANQLPISDQLSDHGAKLEWSRLGFKLYFQYSDSNMEVHVAPSKKRRISALQKNEVWHGSGSSDDLHSSD